MSTTKNKDDFDYQAYAKKHGPKKEEIRRGLQAREARRREATKTRITIRLDEDVIEQFKALVPEGRGYQKLINEALREWLAAQGVKEIVRQEMSNLVVQAVSSITSAVTVEMSK